MAYLTQVIFYFFFQILINVFFVENLIQIMIVHN